MVVFMIKTAPIHDAIADCLDLTQLDTADWVVLLRYEEKVPYVPFEVLKT